MESLSVLTRAAVRVHHTLLPRLAALVGRAEDIYVGASSDIETRWTAHRAAGYTRFHVLGAVDTAIDTRATERLLIEHASDLAGSRLTNDAPGGGGISGEGPFYLYVATRGSNA